jgi:hypothetical protein
MKDSNRFYCKNKHTDNCTNVSMTTNDSDCTYCYLSENCAMCVNHDTAICVDCENAKPDYRQAMLNKFIGRKKG